MKKNAGVIRRTLTTLFADIKDRRVIDAVNLRNLRSTHIFSALVCLFDSVSLALYMATNGHNPNYFKTIINVALCIVCCAVVAVISVMLLRKYRQTGAISNFSANALISVFYIVMSVWSILVDVAHYAAGEQMLTYYIVQFCFVCFVVMRPKLGALLIAVSYAAFYICLYAVDGAATVQVQNYIIFAMIAAIGNVIQNMMVRKSEQAKADILDLNSILEKEVSADDLTGLKNRKALRMDFEKNIGHTVSVIMADIDQFKIYNDSYGHLIGDEVLKHSAAAASRCFEGCDIYRYGGDEFLVLVADRTESEVDQMINDWIFELKSIKIMNDKHPVTASYGCFRQMLNSPDELRNAIKVADNRLYDAKKARYIAVAN